VQPRSVHVAFLSSIRGFVLQRLLTARSLGPHNPQPPGWELPPPRRLSDQDVDRYPSASFPVAAVAPVKFCEPARSPEHEPATSLAGSFRLPPLFWITMLTDTLPLLSVAPPATFVFSSRYAARAAVVEVPRPRFPRPSPPISPPPSLSPTSDTPLRCVLPNRASSRSLTSPSPSRTSVALAETFSCVRLTSHAAARHARSVLAHGQANWVLNADGTLASLGLPRVNTATLARRADRAAHRRSNC
jgi:hypothetical protein